MGTSHSIARDVPGAKSSASRRSLSACDRVYCCLDSVSQSVLLLGLFRDDERIRDKNSASNYPKLHLIFIP